MLATIKTSVSISKTLFDQTQIVAQHLNISTSHLFEMALENFIRNEQSQRILDEESKPDQNQPDPSDKSTSFYQDKKTVPPIGQALLVINQGDIFWIQLEADGSEPSIPHPYVIIQDNLFNHSRINTVVACALTTNIKRANTPVMYYSIGVKQIYPSKVSWKLQKYLPLIKRS